MSPPERMKPAQPVDFLKKCLASIANRAPTLYEYVRRGNGLCIATTCTVILSGFFGLHIVKKGESGSYRISKLRVLMMLAFMAVSGVSLYIIISAFVGNFNYWMFVMTFPLVSCGVVNIFLYLETGRTARLMAKYMKECEDNFFGFDNENFLMARILWTLVSHSFYLLWIYAWLPSDCYFTVMPLVATTAITCVFDLYLAIFMDWYRSAFGSLQVRITSVQVWHKVIVKEIAENYLRVCRAFDLHNQIFSRKLHLRLVLILMQRMSILYGIVTISTTKRYLGLEIIGMFFSFADITLRSYFLCIQGETLYKQYEGMVATFRSVVLDAPRDTILHHQLHHLMTRIEAQAPYAEVWGDNRLGSGTFLQQTGALLTYMAVLLQFHDSSDLLSEEVLMNLQHFVYCFGVAAPRNASLA